VGGTAVGGGTSVGAGEAATTTVCTTTTGVAEGSAATAAGCSVGVAGELQATRTTASKRIAIFFMCVSPCCIYKILYHIYLFIHTKILNSYENRTYLLTH
jgi:hypothetical protein